MAGRRLVDAARLFAAAKSIAKHHLELRSQQYEVFSKTSTLAKLAKEQTDRVTLTLKAAQALAQRLNEETPRYTAYTKTEQEHGAKGESIPRREEEKHAGSTVREGIYQDHHYTRSEENRTVDGTPTEELHVQQEKAQRHPLPDGTIPPAGTPVADNGTKSDTYGQRPTTEAPKEPLSTYHDPALSGHDTEIKPVSSSESTIPDPSAPDKVAYSAVDAPEGIDTAVFRTAKVAQMLGGKSHAQTSRYTDLKEKWDPKVKKEEAPPSEPSVSKEKDSVQALASDIAAEVESSSIPPSEVGQDAVDPGSKKPYQLRESRVPSSRLGRLWEYSGLATSMAFGAVGESFRRATGSAIAGGGSLMLNANNMERLVSKLSRMRGAALKLGQMVSFQDSKMLPPQIHEVLLRVQDSADYMPKSQRNKVLASNLGSEWEKLFSRFDDIPIAAASIGQVHRAVLASTGQEVAVKVQYPGVANSIDSDLSNLSILLTASRLLPKGLFLDKTIDNARTELGWECDYIREAECQTRFRSLLADETATFTVPAVIPEASGKEVLTSELMHGTGVTKLRDSLTQSQRDWIGTQILRLCLREITEFKFMQTDPNWTNFLYNRSANKLELLDFGASRDYPDEFIDPYVQVLKAASRNDREAVRHYSIELGYLTGHESPAMLKSHIQSVLTLGEPFSQDAPEVYDFKDQTITDRVRSLIPVMVRERLAPPPEETYSLHRKLSGAFLLCAKLGSQVRCRDLFTDAMRKYEGAKDL